MKCILFDLDQTLVDSRLAKTFRDSRQWSAVYQLIPELNPYPGINEILQLLREKKIKVGVVTSSPRTYYQKIIDYNKWSFDVSVCYHDTKMHKPDPEPIQMAVNRLGINAVDILSLGDQLSDITASKMASVATGACLWGADDYDEVLKGNPDLIFNTTKELKEYIMQ